MVNFIRLLILILYLSGIPLIEDSAKYNLDY